MMPLPSLWLLFLAANAIPDAISEPASGSSRPATRVAWRRDDGPREGVEARPAEISQRRRQGRRRPGRGRGAVVDVAGLARGRNSDNRPTGLLTDLRRGPALGVRIRPVFSWIVPPCAAAPGTDAGAGAGVSPDQVQVGYEISVRSTDDGGAGGGGWSWESGYVPGNESADVAYGGPELGGGTRYEWNVTTHTAPVNAAADAADDDGRCVSDPSAPSAFVTALSAEGGDHQGGHGWSPAAKFLSLRSSAAATFAYFRTELTVAPPGVRSAVLFVVSPPDRVLLCGHKVLLDGVVIDVGPGRDEAPVWDGDGRARSLPYATLDVTEVLSSPGRHVLALQVMRQQRPSSKRPPEVMAQLVVRYPDGTSDVIVTDESTFKARNGDSHRNPGPPLHGKKSAGTDFVEHVDARREPVGWDLPGYDDGDWEVPSARPPTEEEAGELHPKMEPPMQVTRRIDVEWIRPANADGGGAARSSPSTSYTADFGREFQGGLRLEVRDGRAGQVVGLSCGEALEGGRAVAQTWGWEFNWTLRDGPQTLEQHKYMECRYASLSFLGAAPAPAPANFTLSAWTVKYPWYADDTAFASSDPTLNAVWELSRYTLEAGVVDAFTDSNTRERLPYEADGLVALASRSLLQRDFAWGRKSSDYVLRNPTVFVEWRQLSAFLGWQDYVSTGRNDLALAHLDAMHDRTMIGHRDARTGLLNSSAMGRRHIVDWMPYGVEEDATEKLGEFTGSDFMSVTNFLGAAGLELLSRTVKAAPAPNAAAAGRLASEASDLRAAMMERMWNGAAYCDGMCADVGGASLVMTNMFALALGLVPPAHVGAAWEVVSGWGLEKMGDYGAFWYQAACASSHYAAGGGGAMGEFAGPDDDGTAVLTALTKCDRSSWCSGLRDDNLTMTRESWHNGTYSHPWGASPIAGVVWGVLGVRPTSPAYVTFDVRPKLGSLANVSAVVPTLRGYIVVAATRAAVDVSVPCNTVARVCLPRYAGDAERHGSRMARFAAGRQHILLDGSEVEAVTEGAHICAARGIGCGAAGASRHLTLPNHEAADKILMDLGRPG